MVRKLKDYRVVVNDGSIKCFEQGTYIGSISVQVLCEFIKKFKKQS